MASVDALRKQARKVETDPARTEAYRATLLGILANIRGDEENLTNPPGSPQA